VSRFSLEMHRLAIFRRRGPLFRRRGVGYAPEDLLNLRIELWRVFDRLPLALRSCFLGLFDNTVTGAARRTGVSRSTLYERIAAIRKSFQAADLQLHMAVSDTFEAFPVSEQ
jgi:hypothetical protein